MLSGLLITLNILVCIALVFVVLLQRSEGGAFGSSGSPTGLVTARGAGDLLTRTTWVLFVLFMALSLGLTLLGAHDRSTSAMIDKLKLQQVNPNALVQKPPAGQPAPEGQGAPSQGSPFSPFSSAPAPQSAPPISYPAPAAPKPAAAHVARTKASAPPVLSAPPPQAAPTITPPAPASKANQPTQSQP
ncbi:MAG TPA: preprotein translocase subunit SecG [Caulobacteraceae bacterium]|nr:preprotein translocase subunit SecG [Caulobacteraceae bacterium]